MSFHERVEVGEGVRCFYRREFEDGVERRIVVAYRHNKETGETEYGATIFRRDPGVTCHFERVPHRNTAVRRLQVRPVRLTIDADNYTDVESQLREALREHGVRGPRT